MSRTGGGRLAWTVLVLVVLAGSGAAAWRWLGPPADRLAGARRAYERGDWDRAAAEARLRLKAAGDDVEALRLLARASIRRNRDDLGNAIYKDRLGPERMQPEDYFLVGQSLARLGRNETAMQVWEKGAASGPEHPELLESLARQALALGHTETAESAAGRLARLPGREASGWLLIGQAREQLDDPAAAVEALDRGIRAGLAAGSDPRDLARDRRLLARCRLQVGQADEAGADLENLLAAGGAGDGDREAWWLLSRARLKQGRAAEAADALRRSGTFRDEHPLVPEPGPYVGSFRCVECHREISRAYQGTRHARTFYHGAGIAGLPIPDRPLSDPDEPGVTLAFRRDGRRIRVETRAKDRVFHAVVDYAFGTDDRYLTMIGRGDDGHYRALRLSYYRTEQGSGWGRTSGDVGAPDPEERILGRPIDTRDGVVRCLVCHVTRPRDFREPPPASVGPEVGDPAIGCERCHGPGGNHLAAVAADWPDRAIAVGRADKAPAETVNAQCAACHTVDHPAAIRAAPDDPQYVRSPGLTLTFSRCSTESNGRLNCLTCHDPHREAEKSAAFYEARCLACHASGRSTSAPSQARSSGGGRPCPVNATNGCLDCHMPKQPVADLHTSLTDHYIRIRRPAGSGGPGPS